MVARGRLAIGLTRPVLAHSALGLRTRLLRKELLIGVLPTEHRLEKRASLAWRELREESLIILARREGVGLYEAILAACRRARFAPKLAHTPSLISTVLSYVEAGAGVGVIPDSVASLGAGRPLAFRPLLPKQTVDLVMVWSEKDESPPAAAFRLLINEWCDAGLLWRERAGSLTGE